MQHSSKRILIDITHIAQLNFYLNVIRKLSENYFLTITVLNRGKLPEIAVKETEGIKNVQVKILGKKGFSLFSAIFETNILRIIKLLIFSAGKNFRISFANSYHPSVVGRILGFRSITFDDDPQVYDYKIKLNLATKNYYCLYSKRFAKLHSKVRILRCIKEWAYLNKNTFSPNAESLCFYGLEPKKYIFIREVSTSTFNYSKQEYGKVLDIINDLPKEYKVLFSLEDKSKRHLYPAEWIILEEPVNDIHSLIYYSKLLISSGDSMAREGSALGIPGIYIGVRKMYANAVLMQLADFYCFDGDNFKTFISDIIQNTSFERQEHIRNILDSEFIDINIFIEKITKKLIK